MSPRGTAVVAAVLLAACNAGQPSSPPTPRAGDEFEISQRYETSTQDGGGGSGSSRGRNAYLERVVGARDGGLELEYDLPKETTAADRARTWQFPARVFRPATGPMQLLNGHELEARLEGWLKAAKWTRDVCGRWIFTWNAFRIECDPQSVIKTLEALDLRSADLREGASYREAEARGPGKLARKAAGAEGATFGVELEVDPEAVRRARAESDVAVAEIMQKPVTLDAALRARANERISGTIAVTFDTNAGGQVWRRTRVTRVESKGSDGQSEIHIAREVVERRPAPR